MNTRTNRIFMTILSAILILSVFAGVVNAGSTKSTLVSKVSLSNVRGYAAAPITNLPNYAIDSGILFAGGSQGWTQVQTPENVIVGAVAVDPMSPKTLYIGAANELTLYRSTDAGQQWQRVPLTDQAAGGVTDIAVDGIQHLVYVGTDTVGLFRLRDVGSSLISGGQLHLNAPVVDVVVDQNGTGMAFVRTQQALYRAENYGLSWQPVTNLGSAPTALAIANSQPATVYVGTADRGLLKSADGITWTTANNGLGLLPGSRLKVDALAIDPVQSNVLYVATSYLYGSTELHQSPVGVAMTTNQAQNWSMLHNEQKVAVAELLPVSGQTGAVYAVTNQSRTPLALGKATVATALAKPVTSSESNLFTATVGSLAWIVAALAAIALAFVAANDLRLRRMMAGQRLAASAA